MPGLAKRAVQNKELKEICKDIRGQKMTRLKKINYLRRLPWIWLEHLSSPAAAEGSLEAPSTFSSAAAEAEASWT